MSIDELREVEYDLDRRRLARLAVAEHANDSHEARLLLDMLDLLHDPAPLPETTRVEPHRPLGGTRV